MKVSGNHWIYKMIWNLELQWWTTGRITSWRVPPTLDSRHLGSQPEKASMPLHLIEARSKSNRVLCIRHSNNLSWVEIKRSRIVMCKVCWWGWVKREEYRDLCRDRTSKCRRAWPLRKRLSTTGWIQVCSRGAKTLNRYWRGPIKTSPSWRSSSNDWCRPEEVCAKKCMITKAKTLTWLQTWASVWKWSW